jgi:hypothetical protein
LVSTIIGAIFGGSGVTFLTFLIQRHDRKTDKRQEEYAELSRKISEIADAAKVKAYTELAYAFGSDLELGAAQITDDYLHVLFGDVYTKPETTTTDTDTETGTTTTADGE